VRSEMARLHKLLGTELGVGTDKAAASAADANKK
jgi:hypothetical protein